LGPHPTLQNLLKNKIIIYFTQNINYVENMEIILEIIYYLFYGLGAFVFWLFKGCKTSYNDELTNHKKRNGIVATALFLTPLIAVVLYMFFL
jgi:hypothetical protein